MMLKSIITICIIYIFNTIMYFISYIIPKDQKLWIFGAWYGQQYSDNCKYLYEYINIKHPEIRAVWITKNKKVFESIKKKGFEVYYSSSLKGHLMSLRSGVAIVSHSKLVDLNSYIGHNIKIIQLWHGIPLKRIMNDIDDSCNNKLSISDLKQKMKIFFPFLKEDYALIIATSSEVKKIFASAFRTKLEKIKITGYPRNDVLFNFKNNYADQNFFKVIYVPTFRGRIGDNLELISKSITELSQIDKIFKDMGIKLTIKLHPVNKIANNEYDSIKESDSMRFYEEDDLYEHLNEFDCLITDFSSIYFDFLLLDRPIIFAPFEMNNYLKEDRLLYYDYDNITPGPKAKNWYEILEYIKIIMNGIDYYKTDRNIVREKFHQYLDDESNMRVFYEIVKELD